MPEILEESLSKAPIIKRGEYSYFIHPIADGIPMIEPELLEDVTERIMNIADMDVDRIVSVEAMGIPIATALSLKTRIPYSIIRKREYGMEGEVKLSQSTGYSKGELYINGLKKGDRILIVDDVISTGGTMNALVKGLQSMGVEIVDIVVVIGRGEGASKLSSGGVKVKVLVTIDVKPDGVVVTEVAGERN
ncbi:adenine phosphoribosyltransferase [Methanohalophilus levihalophilus]|uniref:hypoxanthine/guanine phosphoribosyltransferase n=1 Tax=Methanohalophilus levihalophilus TaxID=1431282 RepID=UPI001AEA5D3C|nr:hypoxanthine/guanine phosphoribosyltransferase [Methanohalophilus levihalophilus]MBP2030833.1 adenine phosphoribosyltransferase [Methanohalophilus levihalophilus]